jgi:hypothetical protein
LVIVDEQKGMADYYPLISRAVGALDKPSKEARRALYDRARATLAEQVRRVDPPLSETDLEHERLALEDAIRRVDADATLSEAKIAKGLETQSDNAKSRRQSQPADNLKQLEDYFAAVKASMAPPDAKQLPERHLRRLGNVLLLASVLIAGGRIVFAVEWLGAGLEEWGAGLRRGWCHCAYWTSATILSWWRKELSTYKVCVVAPTASPR